MLFNSLAFLLFFPLVCVLYFVAPHRLRWGLLLAASGWFYMSFIPAYILILLITIVIDYCAAIWIEDSKSQSRQMLLTLSIISTCLVLFIFKYLIYLKSYYKFLDPKSNNITNPICIQNKVTAFINIFKYHKINTKKGLLEKIKLYGNK